MSKLLLAVRDQPDMKVQMVVALKCKLLVASLYQVDILSWACVIVDFIHAANSLIKLSSIWSAYRSLYKLSCKKRSLLANG